MSATVHIYFVHSDQIEACSILFLASSLCNARYSKLPGLSFSFLENMPSRNAILSCTNGGKCSSGCFREWSAGESELEQAALVLNIVSCLPGMDAHMPHSSSQLKSAIYLLTIRYASPDAKSIIPAVSRLADSQSDLRPEVVALVSCARLHQLPDP